MASISSWADLPPDLLVMIAKCLKSRIDICRFRSVCTSWRSSVLPFQKPLHCALPLVLNLDTRHSKYSVFERYIYFLEPIEETSSSLNSCIVAVEELQGCKIHLLDLFRCDPMVLFSSHFSEELNLLNFRITELHKFYSVESTIEANSIFVPFLPMPELNVLFLDQSGCETVIAVFRHGKTLSFFKLGTEKWVLTGSINQYKIQDIGKYKGKVCAMFEGDRGAIIDSSSNIVEFASPTYPACLCCDGYLVESLGDLFLVDLIFPEHETTCLGEFTDFQFLDLPLPISRSRPSIAFKVYELHSDEEEYRWIEVKSLGDRVMFGSCCPGGLFRWSLCLSSHLIPGLRNCIIFTYGFGSINVKDLDDVLVFSIDTCKLVKIDQFPSELNMLWPF